MPTIARKQTLVQFTDDLIRRLDERAAHEGRSRSAVIRDAVETHLGGRWDEDVARMYREAYGRQPQTADELEFAEWAAIETGKGLDAEDGGW